MTGRGAPPSPDSTGRSWAPSWQSARGTHRQPLSSSPALGWAGWAGGGEGAAQGPPCNPLPRVPSRAFPGHLARPLPAPQPSVPERTRRGAPGRAEAGTAR